jgi:hypothetical protein
MREASHLNGKVQVVKERHLTDYVQAGILDIEQARDVKANSQAA